MSDVTEAMDRYQDNFEEMLKHSKAFWLISGLRMTRKDVCAPYTFTFYGTKSEMIYHVENYPNLFGEVYYSLLNLPGKIILKDKGSYIVDANASLV